MLQFIALVAILYLLFDMRAELMSRNSPGNPVKGATTVVMDTSAVIDGRVLDVYKVGFLQGRIIIPKRVLNELQLLADGKDKHKRDRARHGFDIVDELRLLKNSDVFIDEHFSDSPVSTDEAVLKIAKDRKALLCTTDYNLNKVATIENVVVLNVNELAGVMRPKTLPGEVIQVKIIQKGELKGQGVGYLDDGTMAVVDNAFSMQGKIVSATVDRMIQTKAGKMIFATRQPKAQGLRKDS